MGVKPRKNIQKLHNVIHNTAARYGLSLMGVKPRKDIQKLHIVIHGHRCLICLRGAQNPGRTHKSFMMLYM